MTIEQFNVYIKKLEGCYINKIGRCADMLWINIVKNNDDFNQEYDLHVQCPWRIRSKGYIMIASYDMYIDATGEYIEKDEAQSVFDNYLSTINNENLIIHKIEVSNLGDIKILLGDDSIFETFTNTKSKSEESWRFIEEKIEEDNIHQVFPEDFNIY